MVWCLMVNMLLSVFGYFVLQSVNVVMTVFLKSARKSKAISFLVSVLGGVPDSGKPILLKYGCL